MRLVGLSQSDRVKSLGIAGEGDAKDNYTVIRLGKSAIDILPAARTQTRPAILEWKGEQYLLTLDGLIQLPMHSVPISRSWAPVSGEMGLQQQGLKHTFMHTPQHSHMETITNNSAEIHFSIEEIGAIVSMIIQGADKSTAIRSMPRYNRKKHREYAAYYERLQAAMNPTSRSTEAK